MSDTYIKTLKETEVVDGCLWRLLPKAVETDNDGRHWIPETKVVTIVTVAILGMEGTDDE